MTVLPVFRNGPLNFGGGWAIFFEKKKVYLWPKAFLKVAHACRLNISGNLADTTQFRSLNEKQDIYHLIQELIFKL